MANNVVLKSIDLTSTWVPLASAPLVADVTIVAVTVGATPFIDSITELRRGTDVLPIIANLQVRLAGVDLSTLEAHCETEDMRLLVMGNTR